MRWLAASLVLVLLVPACGHEAPAPREPPPPRRSTPEVQAKPGRLTDLGLASTAHTAEGRLAIEALEASRRVAVWRAGLALGPGPSAAACARALDWKQLDADEQRLATRVLIDEMLQPGSEPEEGDFWQVLEYVSSDDLDGILERLESADQAVLELTTVSILHKVTRPRHLPRIAELLAPAGRPVPDQLHELLWLSAEYTDQHREAIATVFVGDDIASSRQPAESGVPPLLRLSLERLFLRGDAKGGGHWAGRWLRDVVPTNADADLLVRLDDAGYHDDLAIWQMRHLDDELTASRLHELADIGDPNPAGFQMLAWGALAVRGDGEALASLRPVAGRESIALALLLQLAPRHAVDALAEVLLDPELGDGWKGPLNVGFAAIEDARWRIRPHYGIEWDDAVFDVFEERALASDVDGMRLARIGLTVPGCGTRRLAAQAARRLRERPPDGWLASAVSERALGFVEVGAPEELRATLRGWTRSDDERARRAALDMLLILGDPEAGPTLVAGLHSGAPGAGGHGELGLALLARSPCDEVREFLRAVAARELPPPRGSSRWQAVRGFAILDGLPEGVPFAPPDDSTHAFEAELADLVLMGRAADAYAAVLAAAPDLPHSRAGDVHDPRVTAYLTRLRDERHLGHHAFAIAELAIQGDPAAREEHLRVLRSGHYRWAEHLDHRQATLGLDPEAIPIWLDGVESNDCQEPTARTVLSGTFGVSEHTLGYGFTSADWYRRWWAEHEGPFVRSRLVGRWLPAPR